MLQIHQILLNSNNNYDSTAAQDLYKMVVKDLIAASLMYPSVDACNYFDPMVYCEVSEGPDNLGKSNCW